MFPELLPLFPGRTHRWWRRIAGDDDDDDDDDDGDDEIDNRADRP